MKKLIFSSVAALALCGVAGCVPSPEPECYSRPVEGEGPTVLVDHYHSRKQNPEDYVLTKTNYTYQGVFGFRRVFDHIEKGGYDWTSIRTMGLSAERLEGFDVLFINLVSSDRPDFTDEEIDVIIDFVDQGGGLFVIVDHTNVYRHAERVNRFLIPMGIETLYSIAVDYPPEHSVAGLGWTKTWDFSDHPVGADLEMISLQTGGAMETENGSGGVAFTSEQSFADYWDPEDSGGYYGNWKFDGDEEVEPKGPLEVVSAVNYGEGRVVVVGDQNIFGDAWTHFGSNFELAMNAFEWAAKQDDVAEIPLRDVRPKGTLVASNQRLSDYSGGKQSANNFFVFFTNLNRDPEISGRGSVSLSNEEDVLMLMNPTVEFTEEDVRGVRSYLKAGKKVVLTFEPDTIPTAAEGLLRELAPDFDIVAGDATAKASEEGALEALTPSRLEGKRLPLSSVKLVVEGLEVGTYDGDPNDEEATEVYEPYLFDVTSSWGEPFLQADADGGKVDIARYAEVDGGELIVFIQDGFFRNRTLGSYLRAPLPYNEDAAELQYRLLDYVKVEQPGDDDPDDEPINPPTEVCQ